jgi:hypothetical protein
LPRSYYLISNMKYQIVLQHNEDDCGASTITRQNNNDSANINSTNPQATEKGAFYEVTIEPTALS